MSFERLVALRYLRSSSRPAVLRLISWLAIVGVTAGVASLVIALAMNTGFRQTLEQRLLGVTAHVNIKSDGTEGIRNYRTLAERLRETPGVRSVAPAIYQTVLLSAGGRARGVVIKGVDPALEARANEVLDSIVAGSADFRDDADGLQAVLVGHLLAEEMQLAAGDYVTLTSPQGRLTPFGMIPRSRRYQVTGVFNSGFYDYDSNWVFVTLPAAQGLAGVSDVVNVLEVRVERLEEAPALAAALLSAAGDGYTASTWVEEHRALFRALQLEKVVTGIFIGLITFVAGLNILVLLAMTVTEKAKDIAILMTLGTRRAQVRTIFLLQGLILGAAGTALGLLVGYGFAWAADRFRWIQLDPQVYALPYVPFRPDWADAFWIIAAALLISVAATLYPARAAARILPVEILRYE